MSDHEWIKRYLAPLVGGRIVAVGCNDDGFPVIVVEVGRKADANVKRFELEISQDEEGNGPGFVFGLPAPRPAGARR